MKRPFQNAGFEARKQKPGRQSPGIGAFSCWGSGADEAVVGRGEITRNRCRPPRRRKFRSAEQLDGICGVPHSNALVLAGEDNKSLSWTKVAVEVGRAEHNQLDGGVGVDGVAAAGHVGENV